MSQVEKEEVLYLNPSIILADPEDNVRFGLKSAHVESLSASIQSEGGVRQPVEVEPLEGVKGKSYRLTVGYHRHAAVTALNAAGGTFTLPALVRPIGDDTMRLKLQLSENVNREGLSLMDTAVAIRKMLDRGMAKVEIRQYFLRPTGKRGETKPVSNAWLNIVSRFLDMPKGIQTRIDNGDLSYSAAYELGRVSPDKRQAVLDRADAERQSQFTKEERDEQALLKAEKKAADAANEVAAAKKGVETTKAVALKSDQTLKESRDILGKLKKQKLGDMDAKAQKEAHERMKAAENTVKSAEKLNKDAKNAYADALKKVRTAEEKAEEKQATVDAAAKAPKAAQPKPLSGDEVKSAAVAEGAGVSEHVPLKLADVRQACKDIAKDERLRVAAIGALFLRCVDGELTPKLLADELEAVLVNKAAAKAKEPAKKA